MNAEKLEAAIDEAGREEVFRRARLLGWEREGVPTFVWWGIIAEIRAGKPAVVAAPPHRLDEELFGIRLFDDA